MTLKRNSGQAEPVPSSGTHPGLSKMIVVIIYAQMVPDVCEVR